MYSTLNISAKEIRLLIANKDGVQYWSRMEIPSGWVKDGHILEPKGIGAIISSLFKSAKMSGTEVASRKATDFVENINQDSGSIGMEPAAGFGDIMGGERLRQFFSPLVENGFVGEFHTGGIGGIGHDKKEFLAAEDSAEAAATGVSTGSIINVIEADPRHFHAMLTGGSGGHDIDFVSEFLMKRRKQIVEAPAGIVIGRDKFDLLMGDMEGPPFIIGGCSFDDDGFVPEPGDRLAEGGARVGFLDSAGQG